MKSEPSKYRDIVAQGWVMMYLVFMAMFITDLTKSAINLDFTKWKNDPGIGGLSILSVVMVIYVFMPMLVKSIEARWFRGLAIGIASFFTLFFIAHQLTHLLAGDKPFGILHILDFSHHALGVWVVVASSLWFRESSKKETI